MPPEHPLDAVTAAIAAWSTSAADAIASVAEHLARQSGASLLLSGLRLFASAPAPLPPSVAAALPAGVDAADLLGELYQRLLSVEQRHTGGIHYTPRSLADGLVAAVHDGWNAPVNDVLDPSMGGGAFLLAVARYRHAGGQSRVASCAGLLGFDIDPIAVAVAEAALALWVVDGGESPVPLPGLVVGDALWDEWPTCDLVVGNPPFLNQLGATTARSAELRASVRERFGLAVGPYADSAAFFLLMGLRALRAGGRMTLVQPVSFLASSHVREIREVLTIDGRLLGLWFTDALLFDASVRVCAPVVEVGGAPTATILRWVGADVVAADPVDHPAARSWGPAVAPDLGVPVFRRTAEAGRLGDLASATAGFRDQFYGFADVAIEGDAGGAHRRLVTTGMVDPFQCGWGAGDFRFNKQTWRQPVVDIESLGESNPKLAAWARDRLRPKVVLATQTKVIEVVVDAAGELVPVTPLISVEPTNVEDLWRVAAVLAAPPTVALALSEQLGAAMVVDAVKLAARQVVELPLPGNSAEWDRGAALAQQASAAATEQDWIAAMTDFGEVMTRAYGADPAIAAWWQDRLPGFARW